MDKKTTISEQQFLNEKESVTALLQRCDVFQARSAEIFDRAEQYVEKIRRTPSDSGVEGFMRQYGLSKKEGIAVLCMAEALLRIPDAETADALIEDKLQAAEWKDYFGKSKSLFINASTYGLALGTSITNLDKGEGFSGILGKMVNRLGEPVLRAAMRTAMQMLGGQFVMGRSIQEALKKARQLGKKGYVFSYDMLGEGARTMAQAEGFYDAYLQAITTIGDDESRMEDGISIKLSAIFPRYELLKKERVMNELVPKLKELLLVAKQRKVAVSLDAEEAERLDIQLMVFEALLNDQDLRDYAGLGFVLQAYQKRAIYVLEWLLEQSQKRPCKMPVRLVKGAYWDSEIKVAQEKGLENYPVFTRKSHTDVSYLACARMLLENPDAFYPQFATHNALTVASILEIADHADFEFQRLFGMGEGFYEQLLEDQSLSKRVRIYAPVGSYDALLPYLIRRLLENGANSSFVNLVVDENEPIAVLLKSPLEKVYEHLAFADWDARDMVLPVEIYGDERPNSYGVDVGNSFDLGKLLLQRDAVNVLRLPNMREAMSAEQVTRTVNIAGDAFKRWNHIDVNMRAAMLERAADLLIERRSEAMWLLADEAGKTLEDAIAEVREAEDFLRYYAAQARALFEPALMPGPTGEENVLTHEGRGVVVCISPWNFPLAIFIGQVAAALVAGNAVLAKPAEQTPRIACWMAAIMHEAGVPEEVLQLVIGRGRDVGPVLTGSPLVNAVAFTGSTETAQNIAKSLAQREGALARLIAETGGQNCMVVDSTALLEQATDDIIHSAFGSAGQRCSALRVCYVQEDIADELIRMLKGAMAELKVGDPHDAATDVGPVIDANAKEILEAHIAKMKKQALLCAETPIIKGLEGHYVAPHLFEIKAISMLEREVFGPILHVIRYRAGAVEDVVREINQTGYGLTFGLHTRIEERIHWFARHVRAGNIYINRSMTGAVVGTQPFGGMGLSGTGPKAGGPHYLQAFVTEKTITNNLTAIGGNVQLLSGGA